MVDASETDKSVRVWGCATTSPHHMERQPDEPAKLAQTRRIFPGPVWPQHRRCLLTRMKSTDYCSIRWARNYCRLRTPDPLFAPLLRMTLCSGTPLSNPGAYTKRILRRLTPFLPSPWRPRRRLLRCRLHRNSRRQLNVLLL